MTDANKADRLVVYTVLMGQVADLNPVPHAPQADFVCFTDQSFSQTNGWQVIFVEPDVPGDSPRSSRHPKVNPHLYLQDYSRSIYVDSSVKLLVDPEHLWNRLVPKPETVFGAMYHSYHFTMLQEMEAVSASGFEKYAVISRYLEYSKSELPGYLDLQPIWGGILARRHNTPEVRDSMEHWYSQILEFSRRDQLSLPLALRTLRGDLLHLCHINNFVSDFHLWPSGGYQKPASYNARYWRMTQPLRVLGQVVKWRRPKG